MAYEQAFMPPYPTTIPLASPPYLFQQPNYQDYFADPGTFFFSPTEQPQPDQPPMKANEDEGEDEDTSSRPRLSPEQLAILEEHFQSHPKPNTDFKRQLAEQLGLSLSRVNNWYQNRRAKQRHQRPQTRRFDVFPDDSNGLWGQPVSSSLGPQEFSSASIPISGQVPVLSNTELAGTDNNIARTEFDDMMMQDEEDEVVPASNDLTGQDWQHSLMEMTFPPLPDSPDLDLFSIDSEVEDKGPGETGAFAPPSLHRLTQPIYNSSFEGVPMSNISTHSFAAFGSSPDESHAKLMTPPEKPSPVTFAAMDNLDRRPSMTSDLISNMDHIQLHREASNRTLSNAASTADTDILSFQSPVSPSEPPTFEVTDTHPSIEGLEELATRTSSAPNIDLASRRKRPRPAALRPEVHRAHSYNGPMTMSPTTRTPSLLGVDSPSVRRMRSAGQNLNLSSGRIMKPSAMNLQLSPRNLQSCMEGAMSAKSMTPTARVGMAAGQLTPQTSESFPSSAALTMGPAPNASYPSQQLGEAGMFLQSPPITPFGVVQNPMDFVMPQQSGYPMPPQSAPPTKTTFFNDSPSLNPQQQGQMNWHTGEMVPPGPPGIVMPEHAYYHHRHSHSQSPPQLPQDYRSAHEMHQPLFYGHTHQLPMGITPSIPASYYEPSVPRAPHKDLEIQVTTIPQPKGPIQGPRTFTFSNITPKDFDSSSTAAR